MAKTNWRHWSGRGHYKWLVLVLFWLIFFLNQADRQVIFSVFPLVKSEMALNDAQLGLLASIFFWVFGLTAPVAGMIGDYVSRRWIVITALCAWSGATLASGFAGSLATLAILRAFTAGGEACYFPAAASMIGDYHGKETRSTALAIHQTSNYLGVMVAGGLAGYLAQHHGWRFSFLVFGSAGIFVALAVLALLREPARGLSEAAAPGENLPLAARLRESVGNPTWILHTLAFTGMLVTLTAYLAWMPTLLYRKFGLGLAEAGFHATFWHHLGAMAGTLAGGRVADRWARRTPLSRPLTQVAGLFFATPFIVFMGTADSRTVVFVSLGLFGLCRGLYDSCLFASPYEVIRPQARATATGLMLAVAFILGGASPLLTGWLSQRLTLGAALSVVCVFCFGAALLLSADALWFFRKRAARLQSALTEA